MNRKDFKIISDWINNESTVLDLGCGDSTLLDYLVKNKNISGYGFEKDIDQVKESIKKNINVIQADFNNGLSDYFDTNFFDYAIFSNSSFPEVIHREKNSFPLAYFFFRYLLWRIQKTKV